MSEVAQLCLTLCDPMDYSLPGSSIHVIFQTKVLEWVAIFLSRASSQIRDQTLVSCTGRWIIYHVSHQGSLDQFPSPPTVHKFLISPHAGRHLSPRPSDSGRPNRCEGHALLLRAVSTLLWAHLCRGAVSIFRMTMF